MTNRSMFPVCLALLMANASCGPGSTAQAVRPDDKTAGEALGEPAHTAEVTCMRVPPTGEPLIVDWKTSEQLDLTVAMQKNVAVVTYDCKSIRFLRDCNVQGTPPPHSWIARSDRSRMTSG